MLRNQAKGISKINIFIHRTHRDKLSTKQSNFFEEHKGKSETVIFKEISTDLSTSILPICLELEDTNIEDATHQIYDIINRVAFCARKRKEALINDPEITVDLFKLMVYSQKNLFIMEAEIVHSA